MVSLCKPEGSIEALEATDVDIDDRMLTVGALVDYAVGFVLEFAKTPSITGGVSAF